jgi:hypothetical protein
MAANVARHAFMENLSTRKPTSGLALGERNPPATNKSHAQRDPERAAIALFIFLLAVYCIFVAQALPFLRYVVREWPSPLLGLIGSAVVVGLLMARSDVAIYRVFVPKARAQTEYPALPSWLTQLIDAIVSVLIFSLVLLICVFAIMFAASAGFEIANVGTWPRWIWLVFNATILFVAIGARQLFYGGRS